MLFSPLQDKFFQFLKVVLFFTTAACQLPAQNDESPTASPKSVLIIYPERLTLPIIRSAERGVYSHLHSELDGNVQVYTEFIDLSRFSTAENLAQFKYYLKSRYKGRQIDAVISVGAAFPFAVEYQKEFFPDAKMLYTALDSELGQINMPPEITGVSIRTDYARTIDLALRLQPNLKEIVCITGPSSWDKNRIANLKEDLKPYEGRLSFRIIGQGTLKETLQIIQHLPKDSCILLTHLLRDGSNLNYSTFEIATQIAKSANVPAYCVLRDYISAGFVGGGEVNLSDATREAAIMSLQWLKTGQKPAPIENKGQVMVNWQALKRWNLPENQVPADIPIHFREPGWWELHANLLLGAAVVCLLQSWWITLLLKSMKGQKTAEKSLQSHLGHMALAAQGAGLGMWTWDEKVGDIWISPLGYDILKMNPVKTSTFQAVLSRLHNDDRTLLAQEMKMLREQGQYMDMEFRITTESGLRWITLIGGVLTWENGRPSSLAGTMIDVTDRKKTERKISQQRDDLAHMNRVSVMGEMAASLAHEISQPLGSILSNAQAGKRFLMNGKTEELAEILDDIAYGAQQAREVIQSIRQMAKKVGSEYVSQDLNQVITEALRLVKADAANRGCVLKIRLTSNLPNVKVNTVQFQQVLLNLVLNALDAVSAMPEDRRRINILTQHFDDAAVRVLIRDFGPGIPEKSVKRLFDRFFTTKTSGMGMGLPIARSIIEAHGGTLELMSDVNPGACFGITLPTMESIGDNENPK